MALSRLLVPDVRGLPRAFWLLFTAALIDRIGGFAGPYLAIFLTGKADVSVGVAGVIVSLLAAGGLIGGPIGGALADKYGRKPMLIGGFVATACSWIVVSQAHGTVAVAVTVFIAGIASSLPRPAMSAAIADVVPEEHRRRAFGLHYWAINLGFAVAASAAGFLANVSWNLVFGLDALTSLVAATLLFVAMKDAAPALSSSPGDAPAKARLSLASLASGPLQDGVFMLLVLQGFMNASMFSQCTVPLAQEMKLDGLAEHYGPLLAINGVLITLLQPTLTQVAERLSSSKVLAWGCALTGIGFFLTAFCDQWWHYAISIGVWTIGEILLASTMPAVIARLAPEQVRATYQGMYMLSWSAASFAPAGGAFLLERWGSWALWGLCLGAGSVGVLVQRRLSREPRMR